MANAGSLSGKRYSSISAHLDPIVEEELLNDCPSVASTSSSSPFSFFSSPFAKRSAARPVANEAAGNLAYSPMKGGEGEGATKQGRWFRVACLVVLIVTALAVVTAAVVVTVKVVTSAGQQAPTSDSTPSSSAIPAWFPFSSSAPSPNVTSFPSSCEACIGPCCSCRSSRLPPGVPSMPSVWWSASMNDGAQIQLKATNNRWIGPSLKSGAWDRPGAYHALPHPGDFFTVERIEETAAADTQFTVRLRTPRGSYLSCDDDGRLHATGLMPTPMSLLKVSMLPDASAQAGEYSEGNHRISLACPDGIVVALHADDSLVTKPGANAAEPLAVRQVMEVPSFRGVGLPGWLVTEAWLSPALYRRVPLYMDGLQFSIQSMYTGDFLRVNPVKGHVLEISGSDPDDWASFHLRTVSLTDPHLHEIRSLDFSYWSLQNVTFPPSSTSAESLNTLAVTSTVSVPSNDGGWEIFKFHFHRAEPTWFMIQAPNGNFLEVDDNGRVTATAPGDRVDTSVSSYWWTRGTAFLLVRRSGVRGEWQLGRYWGQEEAGKQLENHRATWVTEEDFNKLQSYGINSVRVPVGYWLAEEGMSLQDEYYANVEKAKRDDVEGEAKQTVAAPYPFTAGGLKYLDFAFDMGEKYGLRVFISLHGAPHSQNGYEHSGSRDGIPDWASDFSNIPRTVAAVEFLAARYADRAAFAGIGLLNEPSGEGVPFDLLHTYYKAAYAAVRKHSSCAYVSIMARTGEDSEEVRKMLENEALFTNVIHEDHFYNIFQDAAHSAEVVTNGSSGGRGGVGAVPEFAPASSTNFSSLLAFVQGDRKEVVSTLQPRGSERLGMVGEWSLAAPNPDDLADEQMRQLAGAQLEAFSHAKAGWFFFSHRLGRPGWPRFSLFESVENGWFGNALGMGWV